MYLRLGFSIALLVLLSAPAAAQQASAALTVTVASATGEALSGARVSVEGVGGGWVTDAGGRVSLRELAPGRRTVEVHLLGHAPALRSVLLEEGAATTLAVRLQTQALPVSGILVVAEKPVEKVDRSVLATSGFNQRMARGIGDFITRADIEERRPRFLSDMLRRIPGIVLRPGTSGRSWATMGRSQGLSACAIQYFMDGVPTALSNIDDVQPGDVEGVEVYRGTSQIPAQFNRRAALCGVIVIWTRVD